MMIDFNFSRTPNIFFGPGKFSLIPVIVRSFGRDILLVTGNSSFEHSASWDFLNKTFKQEGIKYHRVTVSGEPSPQLIDNVTKQFAEKQIDTVLAIGGGSVIDAGKAISAMLPLGESVSAYLEGMANIKIHPGRKVPFIAVPTTSGTGSEATKNAVLSHISADGFKKSLRHDNFVPDIALIDPQLTMSNPMQLTAACGMDALSQLIESYLSTKANPITDSLAFEAISILIDSISKAFYQGQIDIEARCAMSYASFISGITLANAGLGLVHGFASPIGGFFDIPHGVVCGTLLSVSMKYTVERLLNDEPQNPAIKKIVKLGKKIAVAEGKTDDYYCYTFITYLESIHKDFQIPNLSDYGIKASDFQKIINKTALKNSPVDFTDEELYKILLERL